MGPRNTDFLLLRCVLPSEDGLVRAARTWCREAPQALRLHRLARESDSGITYVYGALPWRAHLEEDVTRFLHDRWRKLVPAAESVEVSRLEQVFAAPGHSRREAPRFHYVVEMDPEPGWMPSIERWYDEEHMPGLAAVPGTVHAMRLLAADHAPLSRACYDLVAKETRGSPAWMEVRRTPWSERMRPKFTNTRRTMLEVLA